MRRHLSRLPLAMLLGLVLMAAAGVLDVVVHVGSAGHHAHESFVAEHFTHLIGIAGMVLVMAGLVIHGARRHHRRPRAARHGGLDGNAHR